MIKDESQTDIKEYILDLYERLERLRYVDDRELEAVLKYTRGIKLQDNEKVVRILIWDPIYHISNIDVPLYSNYQIYL